MRFIDNKTVRLLDELEAALSEATDVCIAVAFVRESGVNLLLQAIRKAIERGVTIRLLFGLDFSLSESAAVRALMTLGVDVTCLAIFGPAEA